MNYWQSCFSYIFDLSLYRRVITPKYDNSFFEGFPLIAHQMSNLVWKKILNILYRHSFDQNCKNRFSFLIDLPNQSHVFSLSYLEKVFLNHSQIQYQLNFYFSEFQ